MTEPSPTPRSQRALLLLPLLLASTALPAQADAASAAALRGFDPVALCRGEELPGRADLQATHGAYTYRFASEQSLATFRADPERHAIQWGGACARMGPLSGRGDMDRWLVHAERIYIFASDACRTGFEKRAERFVPVDEPRPETSAEAAARGAELLAAAIEAHGGAERLRSWRTYRHERAENKDEMRQEWRVQVALPATLRRDHDWLQGDKAWRFHHVVTPNEGFFVEEGKAREMHAVARREALGDLLHEPAFALRAALLGKPVVAALGKREVQGLQVHEFVLWQQDCTTIFGVGDGGRIVTARYRSRGPGQFFGDVVKVFRDQETRAGIVVPLTVTGTFDGAPTPAFEEHRDHVTVDEDLGENVFARPR